MIKLDKTTVIVPTILAAGGRGEKAVDKLKAAFDSGNTTFDFESAIYGHASVKETLKLL